MNEIILSPAALSLKPGRYEHYKGKYYQVLGIALHSETYEELVVYKTLYGQGLTWVRPLRMFTEIVTVNGEKKPRFAYIAEN